MLRSQALTALFNENVDTTALAIFFSTLSGHLIGSSTPTSQIPSSLLRKVCILGTSSYAYYGEQALTSDSISDTQELTNGNRQMSTRGAQNQRGSEISNSVSSRTSSVRQAKSGYPSVQPLPLLARADWSDGQQDESKLRRIIVQLHIGSFANDVDGTVRKVSRLVAIEEIGQGLVIGAISSELEEEVVAKRSGEREENEDVDASENEDQNGEEEDDREEMQRHSNQNGSKDETANREKARQIRLLDIKTEALAEFMRGEFEGFRMPKVDL